MWPGISEAGCGLVQTSECPQWEIIGLGMFRISHSPKSVSEIRTHVVAIRHRGFQVA